jgi:hypothetical protein
MYETMAEVTREGRRTTTATGTTTGGQIGVPGTGGNASITVTVTISESEPTISAQEPVGYYKMNDGSVYQINCLTGETNKIS